MTKYLKNSSRLPREARNDHHVISGKLAENDSAEMSSFAFVEKEIGEDSSGGCPVDTPNTTTLSDTPSLNAPDTPTPPTRPAGGHLTDDPNARDTRIRTMQALAATPEVQALIRSAQRQSQRSAAREATWQQRIAVPQTSWKRATQDEKFLFAGHSTQRAGGLAFSLNLSDETQAKIKKHGNPLRAFTDRLNRALKKRGLSGMPYALSVEDSAQEKLHVHGFLIPPPGAEEALRRALRAAGGCIPGKQGSRQLTLKKMADGGGWAYYCRKDLERTNEVLEGEARLFLNRAMTQATREYSSGAFLSHQATKINM